MYEKLAYLYLKKLNLICFQIRLKKNSSSNH